jgi:two-component system response regulator AtoC
LLLTHPFPGNVRELSNMVERLVIFADGDAIELADVERELNQRTSLAPDAPSGDSLKDDIAVAKKTRIRTALAGANGNRTKAARLLGVSRRTLYNWMGELGLI